MRFIFSRTKASIVRILINKNLRKLSIEISEGSLMGFPLKIVNFELATSPETDRLLTMPMSMHQL